MSLLPWQMKQWAQIQQQAASGSLAHAYLFNGLKGIGKLEFAKLFAASALCVGNKQRVGNKQGVGDKLDGVACGDCKQCKLLASGTHADLRLIEPEEESAIIKVDAIRGMVDFVNQSSLQGGLKIVILHPAEALNINAANALLKTLEEPSRHSLLLLVSHSAGQLLPTIRSRCQLVDFGTPEPSAAVRWLAEQVKDQAGQSYRETELKLLLELAQGAPLKAQEYALSNALTENNAMLDQLASVLKNELVCSVVAEKWSDELFVMRLAWMISWLERIVQFKMAGRRELIEGRHGEKMLSYLATRCSEHRLFELYHHSLAQYRLFLGTSNPNKQLAFEQLLNQWSGLMR